MKQKKKERPSDKEKSLEHAESHHEIIPGPQEKRSFIRFLLHIKQREPKSIGVKKPGEQNNAGGNKPPIRERGIFHGIFAKKIPPVEKNALTLTGLEQTSFLKKRDALEIKPHHRKNRLIFFIERSGMKLDHRLLSKKIFNIAIIAAIIATCYFIFNFVSTKAYDFGKIFLILFFIWTFGIIILVAIMWVAFYLRLDIRMFKRNADVEDVLPDFLQLTASNIKAGMTVDKSLFYAVRPRFGVLANEIEIVAKETMSGKDLKDALNDFTRKFDSVVLKRSISLLIEGIESGGEIGELLVRISSNIQETKIMKQEMAANVTTYVIFVSFATILAAPLLFALSGVLIQVIQSISATMSNVNTVSTGMSISFSGGSITYSDFNLFAIVTLIITSLFSAAIIATITKGEVRAGFKYIPLFIFSSLAVYFLAKFLLGGMLVLFI